MESMEAHQSILVYLEMRMIGKWKLFKELSVEPTTTVDIAGSGYSKGTLVSDLEGDVTGQVSSLSNHDIDHYQMYLLLT